MTKQVLYRYLGTNGTILTPIHLEGAYGVKLIKIIADSDKMLTCDNGITLRNSVLVPEE
jgi:hypothetical protein